MFLEDQRKHKKGIRKQRPRSNDQSDNGHRDRAGGLVTVVVFAFPHPIDQLVEIAF